MVPKAFCESINISKQHLNEPLTLQNVFLLLYMLLYSIYFPCGT
uniref:Uncharacterized protein n=1 Tax=Rhizophora mucronata TaxID=61149 RepID=A0A2P2NU29_RHIMU